MLLFAAALLALQPAASPPCSNPACGDSGKCSNKADLYCRKRTCAYFEACLFPAAQLLPERHFVADVDAAALFPKAADLYEVTAANDGETACTGDDEGAVLVFTDYYYYQNYYHLHVDLLLRLFALLEARGLIGQRYTLMPFVQREFLKGVDWDSRYFEEEKAFGVHALRAVAGEAGTLEPLTRHALSSETARCLRNISFGLGYVDYLASSDQLAGFMERYASFMRMQLGFPRQFAPQKRAVALISRKNRRRIVNEKELVEALREATGDSVKIGLIAFERLSFHKQVKLMEQVTVLIGMNGAGLINALYLHPEAVAIQLVPYESAVNYDEFGMILKTRGPYLEWHNTHRANMVVQPGMQQPEHHHDTAVDPAELVPLVRQALGQGINAALTAAAAEHRGD